MSPNIHNSYYTHLRNFFAGTTILRLLVFPLVVVSQRHTVKMNNNMPQIQAYQEKMTDARLHGNPYESKFKLSISYNKV